MKLNLSRQWFESKLPAEEGLEIGAGCPAVPCLPARVTLSRRKGWRMPPNTVKVCRPGRWGNPYRVGVDGDQAECVELFRRNWGMFEMLNHADIVKHLRGKNLACWCAAGTPCHADVLLSLANAPTVPTAGLNTTDS